MLTSLLPQGRLVGATAALAATMGHWLLWAYLLEFQVGNVTSALVHCDLCSCAL